MWFAFILWTTDIYNNSSRKRLSKNRVVFCFHSLNYWYLQQLANHFQQLVYRCDLLSFFELLIFTTTIISYLYEVVLLWFAFILWTTDIYNNSTLCFRLLHQVVICFHSLNYWYLQQLFLYRWWRRIGCDLLSFFELLIFTTTSEVKRKAGQKLWFAFILWTTDIYNNTGIKNLLKKQVVICFHSLNYWYLQQLGIALATTSCSCDLLSFFELLIFTTTFTSVDWTDDWLWFAFILWTTDIYNNQNVRDMRCVEVVICFHSLNYWYLQQLIIALKDPPVGCDLLSFFELLIFTTTFYLISYDRA